MGPPSHAPPSSAYTQPTSGEVLLFDTMKLEAVNVVEAHRSPLSCVVMNNEGTLLATASDKGTIVRVFSVPQAEKLYQFRRGSIPSSIYNMSFNLNSTLLCVSSATETVHIFRLGGSTVGANDQLTPTESRGWRNISPSSDSRPASAYSESSAGDLASSPTRMHNGTLGSMIRRSSQTVGKTIAASVGGYLPTTVTEMWEPSRDFAYIKIPKESNSGSAGGRPVKSVVAMNNSSPEIMVVTSEGSFYLFGVDMEKGGEGVLMQQYSCVFDILFPFCLFVVVFQEMCNMLTWTSVLELSDKMGQSAMED